MISYVGFSGKVGTLSIYGPGFKLIEDLMVEENCKAVINLHYKHRGYSG
jgi:hypothetical protein